LYVAFIILSHIPSICNLLTGFFVVVLLFCFGFLLSFSIVHFQPMGVLKTKMSLLQVAYTWFSLVLIFLSLCVCVCVCARVCVCVFSKPIQPFFVFWLENLIYLQLITDSDKGLQLPLNSVLLLIFFYSFVYLFIYLFLDSVSLWSQGWLWTAIACLSLPSAEIKTSCHLTQLVNHFMTVGSSFFPFILSSSTIWWLFVMTYFDSFLLIFWLLQSFPLWLS
jgi:hypothetical protein